MLKLVAVVAMAMAASAVHYYDRPAEVRQRMMGTRMDMNSFSQDHEVMQHSDEEAASFLASAPNSFDAAKKWPQCASIINYIKDQAACGSCWAVAASNVVGMRGCISCGYGAYVNGTCPGGPAINGPGEGLPCEDASGEQIMACCSYCGDGCQGGYPIDAMKYWCENGVVSGGWYHSGCGCQPYEVSPTNHNELPTPQCSNGCQPNYPVPFQQDKRYCNSYKGVKGASAIQQEIMTNGPIECAFTVKQSFEDFFRDPKNAKRVYKGSNKWFDRTLGGHAITVRGWGVHPQDGPFWLINNSWNTTWADNGMFRYKRTTGNGGGLDGMEAQCVTGVPKCGLNNAQSQTLQCLNN